MSQSSTVSDHSTENETRLIEPLVIVVFCKSRTKDLYELESQPRVAWPSVCSRP